MRIVVLVKHVPDASADRGFDPVDSTVDRVGVDGVLSELDEYAVEEALTVAEADASGAGEVVLLTMGPEGASAALRKGLQMGAASAVHVLDDALHGSDTLATSVVLAAAIQKVGDVDLVLTGMASTDAYMSVVPAMLAERLGLPHVGSVAELHVGGGGVEARRDGEQATETVRAALPAIVSVTDQINDPRYPSFKGIMAAKKKPVTTWSIADLGIAAADVGLAGSRSAVQAVTPRPPRAAGVVVVDEGDGGTRLADFLVERRFA